MAKRCGTRNNPCTHPRSRWWKDSLGVDWFDQGSGGVVPENAVTHNAEVVTYNGETVTNT